MSRDIAPFGVRLPEPLKQKLLETARKHRRSMNSELILRLEQSLEQNGHRGTLDDRGDYQIADTTAIGRKRGLAEKNQREALLAEIDRLTPARRAALLAFLRGE